MHHIFYGAGIQRGLVGSFGLGSFVRLQSRCQVGLQICEHLGQRICLHESLRRLEGSCWSLVGIDFSSGLLECPYNMTAEFPKSNQYKRKGGRKLNVCIIKIQRSYAVSLSSILLGIEARHDLIWEETEGYEYQDPGILGCRLGGWLPYVPSLKHGKIK